MYDLVLVSWRLSRCCKRFNNSANITRGPLSFMNFKQYVISVRQQKNYPSVWPVSSKYIIWISLPKRNTHILTVNDYVLPWRIKQRSLFLIHKFHHYSYGCLSHHLSLFTLKLIRELYDKAMASCRCKAWNICLLNKFFARVQYFNGGGAGEINLQVTTLLE